MPFFGDKEAKARLPQQTASFLDFRAASLRSGAAGEGTMGQLRAILVLLVALALFVAGPSLAIPVTVTFDCLTLRNSQSAWRPPVQYSVVKVGGK